MFRTKLRNLRLKRHETQAELAKLLGFTRPAYIAYESGKRTPDCQSLIIIAEHFGVTIDYLLGMKCTSNNTVPQQLHDLDILLSQGDLTYHRQPISDNDRNARRNILNGYFSDKGHSRMYERQVGMIALANQKPCRIC